ncbi:LysR family transcriptional regulator ArgP [Spongisporangium articulatum]|uniref:LysR family transcriptional regulator ArgP n=1 Tax=Spongisporangium articulatum TaxID=3362603 RepID=A0ABW8AJL8_9ACTN
MDLQLDQLRALAAVVDEGTFDAAARSLRVTPSAVSQRIKALETAVGRVLLLRTKPARVTESGAAVLRLARELDVLIADTAAGLAADTGAGPLAVPLVVVANADSLATWMLPALAALGDRVLLELRREDQAHSAQLLRDGTATAAVTSQAEPVPGCTSTLLGRMRYRPRAAPAFVARWFPDGVDAPSLARAPVVHFDRKDDLQNRYLRSVSGPAATPPEHYVPGSWDFAEALRLGLGWGMLPDLQDTVPGALVRLDEQAAIDVPLYWQQPKLRTPALDLVAAAVAAAAKDQLL